MGNQTNENNLRRAFLAQMAAATGGYSSAAIGGTPPGQQRGIVALKDFGAAGDGSTDDSETVSSALATGRDVHVSDGFTFVVAGLVVTTPGQRIFGAGTLKLRNSANQSIITVAANAVVLEGVTFDGNRHNQSTLDDSLASLVYLTKGVSNVQVRNCVLRHARRNGIAGFGNHTGCKFVGNNIESPGFIGIYPSSGSGYPFTHGVIADNYIADPGQDGIGTVSIQHSTIVGNRIVNPVTAGIALEAGCRWTTVTGNSVLGNAAGERGTSTGIQVNDSNNISVTANTVTRCGNGIGVSGGKFSHDVTVCANALDDCGHASAGIALDTSIPAGHLSAYKYGVVCVGNTILNSRRAGILVNGHCGAIVCENVINGFNLELAGTVNRQMAAIVLRAYSHDCNVSRNSISDSSGGNLKAGIVEVNDGGQAPVRNLYHYNEIAGLDQDICVTFSATSASHILRPLRSASAPMAFTWPRGAVQLHSHPAAGDFLGWISTDPRGGTFSRNSWTGSIDSASASLVLNTTDGLFEGMSVSIAGADGGLDLNTVVMALNRKAKTAVLHDKATKSVTEAAITPFKPSFSRFAPITLDGSAQYEPPHLASGQSTITSVRVPGAALGDFADASYATDLQGVSMAAWVSSADIVSVSLRNDTGRAIDLRSGLLRARVSRK